MTHDIFEKNCNLDSNSSYRDIMSDFLKGRGDVRKLLVYKLANYVSVLTEIFVAKFIVRGSRTVDQMQQAARSCKQNIVEGSGASMTSKETEIKLTNVARASLDELEEDYLDYLTFHKLEVWGKDHPRIRRLREYIKTPEFEYGYRVLADKLSDEEFCNMAITLIKQTQYLLDRMLASQQKRFLEEGGIREAMSRARREYRSNQMNWNNQNDFNPSNNSNSSNNSNNSNLR